MNRTIREMTQRMKANGSGKRKLFHWLSGPTTKGAPVRWNTQGKKRRTEKGMRRVTVIRPILAPAGVSGVANGVHLDSGLV